MTLPQQYDNVQHLAASHGAILPRPYCWRLLKEPMTGMVSGLFHHRGIAVASNGILLAIVTGNGSLTYGHEQHFLADVEKRDSGKTTRPNPPAAGRRTLDISEFI